LCSSIIAAAERGSGKTALFSEQPAGADDDAPAGAAPT
jgi:hypothetical protein